jgi:hypothetical protein
MGAVMPGADKASYIVLETDDADEAEALDAIVG